MITVQFIIDNSKPHSLSVEGARQTRIYNENLEASIVGGASGLYGDFKNDFELAIFDRMSGEFVTKFFLPDNSDDVVPYMEGETLTKFLNEVFHSGFQVR
jgi:hypothetical protein